MRRLLAGVAALVILGIGAQTAAAEGLPWGQASLDRPDRPDLGCHRVYFTPPGWGGPVEIEVCP